MRQYDYIMDVDQRQIGIARSKCTEHPNMIMSELDYLDYGTDFGLEFDEKEALTHQELEYITSCDHEGMYAETASSSR